MYLKNYNLKDKTAVVTGAGKSFCVGADMVDLATLDPEEAASLMRFIKKIATAVTSCFEGVDYNIILIL